MHSRTVARFDSRPTSVAQPRTPVSGTTSDARIMTRLECRYGDMTQSRLTCPVIRSGDGRRAGTARLGREPTTYRLICVHDSVAAYSHLTRRTTDLARGDMRGGDSGVGDAGAGFRAGRLVNSCVVQDVWRSTVDVGRRSSDMRPDHVAVKRVIATTPRCIVRVGSQRICDVPTRRRWIACSGEAVRRSRIRHLAVVPTHNLKRCRCNSPTTSSGRATVSRPPRDHRPSRRLRSSPGLALPSRFHQRRLAFVRVYQYDRPTRILNSPSNDAEYLLPTATVSN